MARLVECSACQMGDHKRHYKVVQAVSPGMLGGAVCPCKGECKDKTPEQIRRALGIPEGLAEILSRRYRG